MSFFFFFEKAFSPYSGPPSTKSFWFQNRTKQFGFVRGDEFYGPWRQRRKKESEEEEDEKNE